MNRMKSYLTVAAIIAIMIGLLLLSVSVQAKDITDEVSIQKRIQIREEQGQLSPNTFLIGKDAAYTVLIGTITEKDSLLLWIDLQILKARKVKNLHVYINSMGGSGTDGLSYANQLMAIWPHCEVTTYGTGIVASAAIPILLAGKHRIASSNTLFMIHKVRFTPQDPSGYTSRDLEANKEATDIVESSYRELLKIRTKLIDEQINKFCDRTTWFTAKQALEWGFIDEIR